MVQHHSLTPAQVISAMKKDGKPADKLKRVEGILDGTIGIHSVSLRKKVKIPPKSAKIYSTVVKNKRSSIFIEGLVEGKKAVGILTNVLTSSIGSGGERSRSRSRSKSPKRRPSRSGSKKRRKSKSRR